MKRYTVKFTSLANADISAIFEYTLEKSQNFITATRCTDRLFERCEKIGDVPFGVPYAAISPPASD